jgi:hypothetical protein
VILLFLALVEMARYTKRQLTNHIRDLLKGRPETLRAVRWACIIKNGKLNVATRLSVMPTDFIIVECVLKPGQLPSALLIYFAVWKNWSRLTTLDTECMSSAKMMFF